MRDLLGFTEKQVRGVNLLVPRALADERDLRREKPLQPEAVGFFDRDVGRAQERVPRGIGRIDWQSGGAEEGTWLHVR